MLSYESSVLRRLLEGNLRVVTINSFLTAHFACGLAAAFLFFSYPIELGWLQPNTVVPSRVSWCLCSSVFWRDMPWTITTRIPVVYQLPIAFVHSPFYSLASVA
jgi:hypothetical protein